jgi:dTDP-D-glucose 4,6-dehydratase
LNPTNPYSATKAGAEFIVQSYYKSHHLPIIITRGNNVFGPRQYPEKLIPKFICLLTKDKPCTIHGTGQNKRNFIHVDDVVAAFDTILRRGMIGEIYNIGTDYEISNLDVAKTLIKIFGKEESSHLKFVEDRPFNDFRYAINFEKLKQLGWNAEITWEDGLKKTIEWYSNLKSDHWESLENALVAHPRQGMK